MNSIWKTLVLLAIALSVSLPSEALKCYDCEMKAKSDTDPCFDPVKNKASLKECDKTQNVCVKQFDGEAAKSGSTETAFLTRSCDNIDVDDKPCEEFGEVKRCYCNDDGCNDEVGYEVTKSGLDNLKAAVGERKATGAPGNGAPGDGGLASLLSLVSVALMKVIAVML